MAGEPSKWRDIEPILKWGAVSYACGFLIVMIHTARLGIPALQLIEPINVWIGLPITVVLFLFDKVADRWKAAVAKRNAELAAATAQADEIAQGKDPSEVYDLVVNAILLAFTTPVFYFNYQFMGPLLKRIFEVFRRRFVKALETSGSEEKAKVTRKWLGKVLTFAATIVAVQRFVQIIYGMIVIILACAVYVWVLYSQIPQRYGGGRPIEVQLIVNTENIPRDSSYFADVVPRKDESNDEKSKKSTIFGVILYYETEDAYYVRLKKGETAVGPIVSFPHHAVEGIVFAK